MKKFTFPSLLSFVAVLCIGLTVGLENEGHAQSLRIDRIDGSRWGGQPSDAPASASNQYKGFLTVDTWDNSTSTWTIVGSGFGNAQGSVSFDAEVAGPLQISIASIRRWNNTRIEVRVAGHWSFTAYRNIKLAVRTTSGAVTYKSENIVAAPRGRGYGQCTWEVFYQRKNAGLSPPPTAYPGTRTTINGSYIPRQWDVLYWGDRHTAIITSAPQVTRSSDGKTITYRFTVTERNAKWDELMTTRSSELSIRSGTIVQGILSNMSRTRTATSYWR